jgi:hypothetical protein
MINSERSVEMQLAVSVVSLVPLARAPRASRSGAAAVLVAAILGLAACANTVPPRTTWGPSHAINLEPRIFVAASSQLERTKESMTKNRFTLVPSEREANYLLQVDIGSPRAPLDCGATSDVSYTLSAGSERVLVIKGRGKTGTCEPNVLDDMSLHLRSVFEYQAGLEAPKD